MKFVEMLTRNFLRFKKNRDNISKSITGEYQESGLQAE